jgi:hypothetical protein
MKIEKVVALVGCIAFGLLFLTSIYSFALNFGKTTILRDLASFCMSGFYFVLSILFFKNYRAFGNFKGLSDKDADEIFEEVEDDTGKDKLRLKIC